MRTAVSTNVIVVVIVIVIEFTGGCAGSRAPTASLREPHNSTYSTAFPSADDAENTEHLAAVTKKIFSQSQYKVWHFREDQGITSYSLGADALRRAIRTSRQQHSVAGSATVLYVDQTRIGLLSCAHTFDWSDTLFVFYDGPDGRRGNLVSEVAILDRQIHFVQDIPGVSRVDVLAMDRRSDIALLGARVSDDWTITVPELRYTLGTSLDLQWGSFVYAVGYPGGYHMITKALVSKVDPDRKYSFIIDAPFNGGFSGGLVVAKRDSTADMEVVGVVTSGASIHDTVLVPAPDSVVSRDALYDGAVWTKSRVRGRQAITFVAGAERVTELIRRERVAIETAGYDFSSLLRRAL